jgi:hypothetical protein
VQGVLEERLLVAGRLDGVIVHGMFRFHTIGKN